LLVFFLSPSVVITSADGGSNMGNYFWIDTLAPFGTSLGSERKITHKANAGPLIVTDDGKNSEFAPYLQKFDATAYATIEAGHLADGFMPLAETKDRHTAAGHLPCGDHAGGIVFLPGPFQPALELDLLSCLERWSVRRRMHDPDGLDKIGSLKDLIPDQQSADGHNLEADYPGAEVGEAVGKTPKSKAGARASSTKLPASSAKTSSTKLPAADAKASSTKFSAPAKGSAARDIIRQLEEQNAAVDKKTYCQLLTDAAAAFDEADFVQQCMSLCEEQGLASRVNERYANECTIVDRDQTEIIVRVVFQDSRFEDYRSIRRELAALAESIIKLWSQAKAEPAGVLVLAKGKMLASSQVTEETKDDPTFDRIAEKYRISLLTTDTFIEGIGYWAAAEGDNKPSLIQAFEL